MDKEITKEIWEGFHKNNTEVWLSGSKPAQVYRLHDIVPTEHQTIMEIGVGQGDSIRELSRHNSVIAVDISSHALDKVKDISTTYLTPDMVDIPDNTVDWTLCHLVFQHCTDDAVKYLITQSLRVLKAKGFFSFQFALSPTQNISNDAVYTFGLDNDIINFRTMDKMRQLVSECHGIIETVSRPSTMKYGIRWYMMKIKRG